MIKEDQGYFILSRHTLIEDLFLYGSKHLMCKPFLWFPKTPQAYITLVDLLL